MTRWPPPTYFPPTLELRHDTSPARWVEESLSSDFPNVSSLVPPIFEALVRVLHPATIRDAEGDRPLGWREVASMNGRQLEQGDSFESIIVPVDQSPAPYGSSPPWGYRPEEGSLPAATATELVQVLRRAARADRCWFGMWYGFGADDRPGPEVPAFASPTLRGSGRAYYLYLGSLDSIREIAAYGGQTPNYWWPDDRSWFVTTEIDHTWSYVAGSHELIGQIRESSLETLDTSYDAHF